LPGRTVADRAVDVAIEFAELALQQLEMPVDRVENPALGRPAPAIALGDHHLDDLAAACHQLAERLRLRVGNRPGGRADRLGKMSDCRGIDPVGLGQLAGGAGEIADLARIDHGQRQVSRGHRAGDDGFVAAGGLHCDQVRRQCLQPAHELRQAFAVARDGEGLTARPQMHVAPILCHVDPNKMLHVPSPACGLTANIAATRRTLSPVSTWRTTRSRRSTE
jgi:hypothetical protein